MEKWYFRWKQFYSIGLLTQLYLIIIGYNGKQLIFLWKVKSTGFQANALHRRTFVIITLASWNSPLRDHDSKTKNFMSILRLFSHYDSVLKYLL